MTVTFNESVAAEIRAEMARQRLTQAGLAIRLGWNARYLSRRLNESVPFRTDELEHISQALAIPLSALTSPRAATE